MGKKFLHSLLLLAAFGLLMTSCDYLTHSGDDLVASGSAMMADGQYQKAEAAFRKALDLPLTRFKKEQVLTLMGNNFLERGLYDSAVVYHQKAIAMDENYEEAWVNLGLAQRRLKDNGGAEKSYLKALELNPKDVFLLVNLGALYVDTGMPEKGRTFLEKAIQLDGQNAVAHANLATALAMIGDTTAAENELAKTIELDYENADNLRGYLDRQKDSLKAKSSASLPN